MIPMSPTRRQAASYKSASPTRQYSSKQPREAEIEAGPGVSRSHLVTRWLSQPIGYWPGPGIPPPGWHPIEPQAIEPQAIEGHPPIDGQTGPVGQGTATDG